MDNDLELFPLPIIFIVAIYILLVSSSDVLTLILIIVTTVGVITYIRMHQVKKRETEKLVITELINNFINPTIEQLYFYSKPQGFIFPDSLNRYFGISINKDLFIRFSKRKRIIGWKIKAYNKLCDRINQKCILLVNKSKELSIIHRPITSQGVQWMLIEKYEDLRKDEIERILITNNLMDNIKEIEELSREVPEKSKGLVKKLENLKKKWEDTYNIV